MQGLLGYGRWTNIEPPVGNQENDIGPTKLSTKFQRWPNEWLLSGLKSGTAWITVPKFTSPKVSILKVHKSELFSSSKVYHKHSCRHEMRGGGAGLTSYRAFPPYVCYVTCKTSSVTQGWFLSILSFIREKACGLKPMVCNDACKIKGIPLLMNSNITCTSLSLLARFCKN